MKLRKTLAGILGAVVMLLGVGTFEHVNGHFNDYKEVYAANEPVTVTMTSFSAVSAPLDSVASYTTSIGKASTAPAIYDEEIRLYQGNPGGNITITVPSPYELVSVTIGSSMKTSIAHDINGEKTSLSAGGKYTVNEIEGSTITFHCFGSDKKTRLYVNYLSVTYVSTAASDCEHKNTSETINEATCLTPGSSVVTCDDCGVVISNNELPATGHNFVNGVCTCCKLDAISGVKALFNKYYNNNQYLKETVLNTTGKADEEVETYFHASASVKERETWYFGDKNNGTTKLVMNTHEDLLDDKITGEVDVTSTYENLNNKVWHTGKGGDWWVDWTSVEDKFVTLKDFKDSTDTNWVCDDNQKVFTYNLTPATADSEHEMTRMAREFVAPMWLAPNADNYTYARFTKLTVEEKTDVGLIMTLYVHEGDFSKTSGNDGVFAVATINNVYNVEINIEGNGTVVEENRLIAGNHAIEYTVNIPEGHRISSANANGATIGTTTEGFALNKATGDVIVNLVVEEKSNNPITETLSFATTASRKSFSTTSQVWVNGGITFTNNKSTSTNNVADYSNPIRLYKNSEIIIEANQMTKLVLNSSSSSGDYYNALKSSLDAASIKYTNSGTKFTIEFATPVDSFVLKLSGGQVRFTSIDVTYVAE